MSDIEREEFEQAVADKWSDSYKFTRFGDEDYYDEILEGMWWGWQASRQALEGEPVLWWDENDVWDLDECVKKTPTSRHTIPLYTHPASADVPDAEYIRALQDAFNIIRIIFAGYRFAPLQ